MLLVTYRSAFFLFCFTCCGCCCCRLLYTFFFCFLSFASTYKFGKQLVELVGVLSVSLLYMPQYTLDAKRNNSIQSISFGSFCLVFVVVVVPHLNFVFAIETREQMYGLRTISRECIAQLCSVYTRSIRCVRTTHTERQSRVP